MSVKNGLIAFEEELPISDKFKVNPKKVAFISCVNNADKYKTALQHIHSLKIPEGYEIDIITIENAKSLTSGYNEGMRKSDAKYKVYLHQDTYILNQQFIYDILSLFEKYPNLGMLGMVGAKTIPNGVWWNSKLVFGAVYYTPKGKKNIGILANRPVIGDYEDVLVIDGLMIITQYDLPWREDLFSGWHFYDVSQSLEFKKAGFAVGVPKQDLPWCIHATGTMNLTGYEENRKVFVEHYGDYL